MVRENLTSRITLFLKSFPSVYQFTTSYLLNISLSCFSFPCWLFILQDFIKLCYFLLIKIEGHTVDFGTDSMKAGNSDFVAAVSTHSASVNKGSVRCNLRYLLCLIGLCFGPSNCKTDLYKIVKIVWRVFLHGMFFRLVCGTGERSWTWEMDAFRQVLERNCYFYPLERWRNSRVLEHT